MCTGIVNKPLMNVEDNGNEQQFPLPFTLFFVIDPYRDVNPNPKGVENHE